MYQHYVSKRTLGIIEYYSGEGIVYTVAELDMLEDLSGYCGIHNIACISEYEGIEVAKEVLMEELYKG